MNKEQEQINNQFRETLRDHAEHLKIANSEMGVVKDCLSGMKKDIEWIMFLIKSTLVASIGSVIATLINIIK